MHGAPTNEARGDTSGRDFENDRRLYTARGCSSATKQRRAMTRSSASSTNSTNTSSTGTTTGSSSTKRGHPLNVVVTRAVVLPPEMSRMMHHGRLAGTGLAPPQIEALLETGHI